MKNFTLPVTIEAYTEEEAKAKLELLLSLGSFFVNIDIEDLAGKFMYATLLGVLGKMTSEVVQPGTRKQAA